MINVFPSNLSEHCKSSLVKYETLVLRVNTLTANNEFSRHNRENLALPIQTQLSKKQKAFCKTFIAFLESALSFMHYEKQNMSLIA